MDNKIICCEILDYLKEVGESSIGELYIKFHIMNKGKIYSGIKSEEITAKDIVSCIEELYKNGVINYKNINGDKVYYINNKKN